MNVFIPFAISMLLIVLAVMFLKDLYYNLKTNKPVFKHPVALAWGIFFGVLVGIILVHLFF